MNTMNIEKMIDLPFGIVASASGLGEWQVLLRVLVWEGGSIQEPMLKLLINGEEPGSQVLVISVHADGLDVDTVGVASLDAGCAQVDWSNALAAHCLHLRRDPGVEGTRLALDDDSVHWDFHVDCVVADHDRVTGIAGVAVARGHRVGHVLLVHGRDCVILEKRLLAEEDQVHEVRTACFVVRSGEAAAGYLDVDRHVFDALVAPPPRIRKAAGTNIAKEENGERAFRMMKQKDTTAGEGRRSHQRGLHDKHAMAEGIDQSHGMR